MNHALIGWGPGTSPGIVRVGSMTQSSTAMSRGNDYSRARVAAKGSPPARAIVIVLVGLSFEARIAAGPGVFVICRDNDSEIARLLAIARKKGYRSIISFGVAGGLAPHLRTGDWVVASSVVDAQFNRPTDPIWTDKILTMIPGAHHAPILGVDTAVTDPRGKRHLHLRTGAAAADMESHLVARLAAEHDLSFAAARVVIDPAHRFVPPAALAGMLPGGRTDAMAVARALIARPSQLLSMIRLGIDAYVAYGALRRARRLLGPDFGFSVPGYAAIPNADTTRITE